MLSSCDKFSSWRYMWRRVSLTATCSTIFFWCFHCKLENLVHLGCFSCYLCSICTMPLSFCNFGYLWHVLAFEDNSPSGSIWSHISEWPLLAYSFEGISRRRGCQPVLKPGADFLTFPPINIEEWYKKFFDLRKVINQSEIQFDLKQLRQLTVCN